MQNAADVVQKDLEYICRSLDEEFRQLCGKNIFILGGAGFLGYYLFQSLLFWNEIIKKEKAVIVAVIDNYMRGVSEWLANFCNNDHLNLVKHDITNPLRDSAYDFQYIIHAVFIASPIYYRRHPIKPMDANVNGLRYLLESALSQKDKNKPIEGLLFFSMSEIYGDPDSAHIPTSETYHGNVSCKGPRACYDESKRFGEALCVNFAEQYKLLVSIARPFKNYVPRLKITDRRVIHEPSSDENYLVDNPNRRCLVTTKAQIELGYEPVIGLEEGLKRNLLWYKENLEAVEA